MKKTLFKALLLIILCSLLSSCGNRKIPDDIDGTEAPEVTKSNIPTEFHVKDNYELLYANEESKRFFSGVESKADLSLALNTVEDSEFSPTVKFDFLGRESTATYEITQDDGLYNGIARLYRGSYNRTGDMLMRYSLDNKLLFYLILYDEYSAPKPENGAKLNESECYEIAVKKLNSMVDTPSEFKEIDRNYHNYSVPCYYFRFRRMNGNLMTMDSVIFEVDIYGNICLLYASHLEDMKDIPTVPDAVVSKVIKSVLTDIRAKYDTVKDKFSILEIKDKEADICLVRMKDGTVALDVSIEVLIGKNGTDESATEGHRYVVPLE